MVEFGSDFHYLGNYSSQRASLLNRYKGAMFFANGRQCIIALIEQYGWRRIWMPQYFCYEVIDSIIRTGIEVVYYLDYPSCKTDNVSVLNIPFEQNDVLFRVNYFGLRDFRSEKDIPVPVIEDHTHDLLGHWAFYSDATWCIASLRKLLPVAEGGMLWSPKGYELNVLPNSTAENDKLAELRWHAMSLKLEYLCGQTSDKETYREIQLSTEEQFRSLPLSALDKSSSAYLSDFDINVWYNNRRKNHKVLYDNWGDKINILQPENDSCNIFSLIILAETSKERERIRKALISKLVYPAVLWNVPENSNKEVVDFSKRMLSIHCDGRYSDEDMQEVSKRLKSIIDND